MIYDKIENICTYKGISVKLDAAIDAICERVYANQPEGRHVLADKELYYSVQNVIYYKQGRWEAHHEFIDIQFSLTGDEKCRCAAANDLSGWEPYDETRDISFSDDKSEGISVTLHKGWFVVLFPQDAHMPCLPVGDANCGKKIVFKVHV